MTSSTTNEIESILEEKIERSCVENQQRKELACRGLMDNISKL